MYTRGSEWNRWDFHIHTPGTLKNEQFDGENIEEKWKKYYSDILEYIGDGSNSQHKIVGMGVTDYPSSHLYLSPTQNVDRIRTFALIVLHFSCVG